MTIWITGAAGFLGRRLVQRFRVAGDHVVPISRRQVDSNSISMDLAGSDAASRLGRLADEMPPDIVIHAASRQPGKFALSEYVSSNVLATANLLDGLELIPPGRLIFTSTISIYGRTEVLPVSEGANPAPATPYAITKWCAEQLFASAQSRSQTLVLRVPSMYGAGQTDSFVDGLASVALENHPVELFGLGEIVRDALHVEDVVDAVMAGTRADLPDQFTCLNLGCGRRLTSNDFARALVDACESSSEIIAVDRHPASLFDFYADITKARETIGFSPCSLKDSMSRYVDELRSQS